LELLIFCGSVCPSTKFCTTRIQKRATKATKEYYSRQLYASRTKHEAYSSHCLPLLIQEVLSGTVV
jgi:hypothetical protein